MVKVKFARQDILVVAAVLAVLSILWIAFGFYYYLSPAKNLQPEVPAALFGAGVTATSDSLQPTCTNPLSYWVQHPERFPAQLVIGEQVYARDQLSILLSSESSDAALLLLKQLVVAFLNQMETAEQTALDGSLYQAYQWLAAFPPGSQVPEAEREKSTGLLSALEAFNSGRAGPSACQADAGSATPAVIAVTALPSATWTLAAATTLPPSPTSTLTPAPTEPEPTDTPYIPPPTATTRPYFSPTPEPPTKEPPTAEPSDTPFVPTFTLEPTEAPSDTPEPPTPTLAPTDLPTPSPAPTDIPTPTLAPRR